MNNEVTITGLIYPYGAGGAGRKGDHWELIFHLAAWYVDGEALETGSLRVCRHATKEELENLMPLFPAEKIVQIRARWVEENNNRVARIEEVPIFVEDTALQAHLEYLQTPVSHVDTQFGTLTLDRSIESFTTTMPWSGMPAELWLSGTTQEELESALTVARTLWSDEAAWTERVRQRAVKDLLPIKNDNWLDEDDDGNDLPPLTPEEFALRMTLQAIGLDASGEFTFWFDDGDLFFGHTIAVSGSLANGLRDASFMG
jgi:hypothetical protein